MIHLLHWIIQYLQFSETIQLNYETILVHGWRGTQQPQNPPAATTDDLFVQPLSTSSDLSCQKLSFMCGEKREKSQSGAKLIKID